MHKTLRLSLLLAGALPLASGCGAPVEPSDAANGTSMASRSEGLGTTAATWTINAPMKASRSDHTLTVLNSGLVLVEGGIQGGTRLRSAELYDPYTDTWTVTGAPNEARVNARATRLASGKVLVVGGSNSTTSGSPTAELYDPDTGTWSYTGSLNTGRSSFTLTLLDSGKVLVTGGMAHGGTFTSTAEVYDPDTGTWSYTGPKAIVGFFQAATKLYSGEVLVTGSVSPARNAEIYNPSTNSWRTATNVPGPHAFHSTIRLYSGQVLLTGGGNGQGDTAETYLYDPFNDQWTRGPDMKQARGQDHALILLYSGQVMAASGDSAEIYDPTTNTWTLSTSGKPGLHARRTGLLHTGQVLFAGSETTRYTP
ncbi:Kelch repeat-containing protein [Melittangium boletus]|uniref:Branched-chain amino acid ABC transporter substrate-binding protein n=1 Tax=Melittangium boletus DSM 14713 TaxID=1294270 RepID=A0A250ICV8_9BACT|nr:kelch repeat-containing protein [Melittangium boletus]ATB29595.1 hypothetical protein MEBOL_003050 [Melittangium boletus DSM 14713]